MTATAKRSGNDAAEAGAALNSCTDVTWMTAAARKSLGSVNAGGWAGAAEADGT